MNGEEPERTLLVDASVWITLTAVGQTELLGSFDGQIVIPEAVCDEIDTDPAASALTAAMGSWVTSSKLVNTDLLQEAASHLGTEVTEDELALTEPPVEADVALLAHALLHDRPVLVTDDKPLRKTCMALSIRVSGSIGVLVRAVECGAITADDAKSTLYAMDEVGARLSATLVRRAEQLIDDATD
ncbi:DUF3368 domain-containing protein [Haloarcula sp. GH36]|uniref:DUF3368 domain-containing protein n=1 Tax=Haloarcula montana TaxID=3111776 RepID=UPI002D77ACE3|nr:DUF3368 domain-containing protein [Haloarcula sp. GH36]